MSALDAPHPDAKLLAYCERFHAAHAAIQAADAKGHVSDSRGEVLDRAWDFAFERVSKLKPQTPEDRQARASVALVGLLWVVAPLTSKTWEEQVDKWQWLAIDSLRDVAEAQA